MNLTLNLKKKYFEEIKQGIKKEEYRLCTPFWKKRILGKKFEKVIIKLGYPKNSEKEKIIIFDWNGFEVKKIIHENFGELPVEVFSIPLEKLSIKPPFNGQ